MMSVQQRRLEILLLIVFIALFIAVRSVHFTKFVNFSTDQATFAMNALQLWRSKSLVLIGPTISFQYQGLRVYQGSIIYYLTLLFLLIGHFDPIVSSYVFMLFAAVMIVPLYVGVKLLLGKKSAVLAVLLYTLMPISVTYTRFFWNPNYQFALMPLLILLISLHNKYKTADWLFGVGVMSGILLLFHFQFVLVISLLFWYVIFFVVKHRRPAWHIAVFPPGVMAGFSPTILFELRNHFYMTNTFLLYLQHYHEVFGNKVTDTNNAHYFLTLSVMGVLVVLALIKRFLNKGVLIVIGVLLFGWCMMVYLPTPSHAFGMPEHWNTEDEQRVHDIIDAQHLKSFNVANLLYETIASPQKYWLLLEQPDAKFDDYYGNAYLFVISSTPDFLHNPAYEVNTFVPSKVLQTWPIDHENVLYLLEREKN